MRARWILTIIPPVALTLACAAPQEEVESPKAPAEDEAATAQTDEEAEDDGEGTEETSEPEKRDGPPAAELLTATDVAFDFDFNGSAMKEKYEKQCEPSAKDDPGKLIKCVEQKRQAFRADVIWFREDPETGDLLWLIYQRKGTKLVEVFRSPVVFEDEKHESLTVKLSGQGRGARQIYGGHNKVPVMVPTKYGLEIEDPNWGLLKYNSKMGLVQTGNSE